MDTYILADLDLNPFCFLSQTEMEVEYFPEGGSITDLMVQVCDTDVGVSVTRAMKYSGEFTQEDGLRLLNKKLNGQLVLLFLLKTGVFLCYKGTKNFTGKFV